MVAMQPTTKVIRVIFDAEFFVDEFHDTRRRPEVGTESKRRGILREPVPDLVGLSL